MVRVLRINDKVKAEIVALKTRAEANPIPWEKLMGGMISMRKIVPLEARPPGYERPPVDHVVIPDGYRCAFSIEEQPSGLVRHLSVSTPDPGTLPNQHAVKMIADEFGFGRPDHVWLEEFDPGHRAVNLVELFQAHVKQ